jgi:signal transduction histidine kinase
MLGLIRTFCRCDYVVFYGSVQEGDTVLAPIAGTGIPSQIARSLPHFNWKKAGLPLADFHMREWDIAHWLSKARKRGIRGDNSEHFAEADCILPMSLGDRYRGVLVLGPFAEPVDLQAERRFLMEIANTVGLLALTGLEVLHLERERRRWRSTATLLTHQLRTALTPITILIGRAKIRVRKSGGDVDVKRVCDFLSRAEDLALHLSQGAKETIAGHVLQVEAEDLEFERSPLAILVGNCAAGFVEKAQERSIKLVVDDHVESLPEADVDVARLTIALANLIDNAIKYSYPGRTIYIRSHLDSIVDPDLATAVIEIDNLGYGIPQEDRERIFERGTRGLTRAKLGHIPGSGLGLWEARAVVAAHGGEIDMRCDQTSIRRHGGQAYHVVFSMKVPLRQKKKKKKK